MPRSHRAAAIFDFLADASFVEVEERDGLVGGERQHNGSLPREY